MICTSIEQSKHLLELGLPIHTADMFWSYNERWYSEGDEWEGFEDYPTAEPYHEYTREPGEWMKPKKDIPCWSVTALLGMMPREIMYHGKTCDFIMEKNPDNKYAISYSSSDGATYTVYKDLIDSAYEMIVWLVENKKSLLI